MAITTIFLNGRVFGARGAKEEKADFCSCLVISGDKIVHVGHEIDQEVQLAKRKGAVVVDLENRVVVPGFIDGHTHLLQFGLSLRKLDLSECRSLEEIRHAVSEYAKLHPEVPRIFCRGWLQPSTKGMALASMIDDLDPRPILIEALDLHSTWCNTAALKELDLGDISGMRGEHIPCDEQGNPTGLLSELAQITYIWPYLTKCYTEKDRQEGLEKAFQAYVDAGYTGAIDMAMGTEAWELLKAYRNIKSLPIHFAAHWFIPSEDDPELLIQHVDEAIALNREWNRFKSPDFCIIGIKLICDGVVDGCTAAVSHPYGGRTDIIKPLWTADAMNLVIKRAAEAGLQCAIHAIGDVAITQAIDAIAAAKSTGARHRIEHLELATEEDAKRLGQLGITASVQPVHSDPALLTSYADLLGAHSWERAFAYREFLDGNACVALGTDAPTAKHLPLPNLYNATMRKSALDPLSPVQVHPHNALTLSQSVVAASTGAAYSRFAESWTGSLQKGLRADFLVLNTQWTPETLLEAELYQTWSKGVKLYEAAS